MLIGAVSLWEGTPMIRQYRSAPRARTTLASAAILALAASGLVATTAAAAPVGDCATGFSAGTQTEWLAAIAAADGCATASVTITLTDDITLTAVGDPYLGTADLMVDGGGHTVTLNGAGRFLRAGDTSIGAVEVRHVSLVAAGTGVDSLLFVTNVDSVTIHDVALTGTSNNYGIYIQDTDTLHLSDITVDNLVTVQPAIDTLRTTTATLEESSLTDATVTGTGGVVRFSGTTLTVKDSMFERNSSNSNGGALSLDGDSISVSGSRFVGNTAGSLGGAVYALGASLEITSSDTRDSHFENNSADYPGGAVFSNATTTTIEGSTFLGNESTAGTGGAVYARALTIGDSAFRDNTAFNSGGAVFASETFITDSTFAGNETREGLGGAVSAQDMTIVDSTFRDNTALSPGGAVYGNDMDISGSTFENNRSKLSIAGAVGGQNMSISDSTFRDNTSTNPGGAIYGNALDIDGSTFVGNSNSSFGIGGGAIYATDVTAVRNSTFVDNATAHRGGAIYASGSTLTVDHSTLVGNSADEAGSHLYASGALTAYASVFTEGLGGSDTCVVSGTLTSEGFNFDDTGDCSGGPGDIDGSGVDPQLGALVDNNGPTATMLPAATSPLVDAIPGLACASAITVDGDLGFDQRGVKRAQGGGCDIGAVETIPDLTFTIDADSGPIDVTVTDALSHDCVSWESAHGYSPTAPVGVSFPHGIFGYCFLLPGNGWTIDITLDLPSPINELWKVTGGAWTEITDVRLDGTTVTYSVTDGGDLDDDGTVNAEIVDPVAPGIGATFTG